MASEEFRSVVWYITRCFSHYIIIQTLFKHTDLWLVTLISPEVNSFFLYTLFRGSRSARTKWRSHMNAPSSRNTLSSTLTVCLSAQLPERTVLSEAQQTRLPPHRQRLHEERVPLNDRLTELTVCFGSEPPPGREDFHQHQHAWPSLPPVYLRTPHLSLQNKSTCSPLVLWTQLEPRSRDSRPIHYARAVFHQIRRSSFSECHVR